VHLNIKSGFLRGSQGEGKSYSRCQGESPANSRARTSQSESEAADHARPRARTSHCPYYGRWCEKFVQRCGRCRREI